MAKKKASKKGVEKPAYARKDGDVNMDELTRGSDDEMTFINPSNDHDDDEEEYEVGKLNDYDDEDMKNIKSKWDKVKEKEFAEIDRKAKSWGKNKEAYYDADTKYFDVDYNEEEANLEEEQVKSIQKRQAEELAGEDFGLGELIARKTKSTSSIASKLQEVAKIHDLTKDEKIKQVIVDSPELLALLDDYVARMKELRAEVLPLIERLQSGDVELQTDSGISFLQLRYQLLVSYCINVVFYLLLKAEGKNVTNHPVIKRLVQIRIILDKMKPVMTQLQYQIEKLLSSVQSSVVKNMTADKNMLSYKPNLESFGDVVSSKPKKTKEALKSDAKSYKNLQTTDLDRAEAMKNALYQKQQDRQFSSSEMALARELRDELLERPEEMGTIGTSVKRVRLLDGEREEFEEEHYTRLQDTRERKKMRRAAERMQGFDDVDDLSSVGHLLTFEKKQRKLEEERRALQQIERNIEKGASVREEYNSSLFDYDEEDKAAYEDAVETGKATKSAKQKVASIGRKERQIMESYDEDIDMVDADERRGAGMKILKNKGLMRAKGKHGHARVANRAKHEKAMVKHRVQHKEYKGKQDIEYSGESTGINRNVIKAHIFKK